MPPRRGEKPTWAYDAHMKAGKFHTRQPQEIPTPVVPPLLPANPLPAVQPITWPRFEVFARQLPLHRGFYEFAFVQVPEMIVLSTMSIEPADRRRPAFVEAWERSNAVMRSRYGDRLPLWMRRKSRWERAIEAMPTGAKMEVMCSIAAFVLTGMILIFTWVIWDDYNFQVDKRCKNSC